MSHFDLSEWSDYIRGVAEPSAASSMEQHLSDRCAECLSDAAFLRKVTATANTSISVVPASLVQRAKAIFSDFPASEFDFTALRPLLARLVVQASSMQQPTGIRTTGTAIQYLYEAGEYTVDLRQESMRGSVRIALVGQISTKDASQVTTTNLPVTLRTGHRLISSTFSNEFGEFSFTYSPRPNILLAIGVTDVGYRIDIPVGKSS